MGLSNLSVERPVFGLGCVYLEGVRNIRAASVARLEASFSGWRDHRVSPTQSGFLRRVAVSRLVEPPREQTGGHDHDRGGDEDNLEARQRYEEAHDRREDHDRHRQA